MRIDECVLDAIEAVYEAALDETLWHSALQKLAYATGSQAATFWLLDGSGPPRLPTFSFINLDPRLIQEYLDGMAEHDPTVQYLISQPGQSIVHDGLFITEREKDRHLYYDWHHRYTEMRFRLISQMSPAPAIQAGVALHRTRKAGRFERGDVDQFAVLHRHIKRSLALGFRLGSIGTMQQCCTELLDRNPNGIVLLDASQHMVYANQAAERLCGQGDGLRLSSAGLSLARRQDQDRLRELIAQALSRRADCGLPNDGIMPVQRPSGKRKGKIATHRTTLTYRDGVNSHRTPAFLSSMELTVTRLSIQRPLRVWFSGPIGEVRVIGVARNEGNLPNPAGAISAGTCRRSTVRRPASGAATRRSGRRRASPPASGPGRRI
jgi:PAS domain-containing protein